jgi:hypothetical protein
VAAAFHPAQPNESWIAYSARLTATKNELRTIRVDRGSLDVKLPAAPLLGQPDALKGVARLTSVGGKPYFGFISNVGLKVDVYLSAFSGSAWQAPTKIGDEDGVPLQAVGLDIFGEAGGGVNVVHAHLDQASKQPVLLFTAGTGQSGPEVVSANGRPLTNVGRPTVVSAEGATGLAYTDLAGTVYFTARMSPKAPWLKPIPFDDTGAAGGEVRVIQILGVKTQGIHVVYRRASGGSARLIHRRITCLIPQ